MAYETESGNFTKPDVSISAVAAPAFVEKAKVLAQGYVQNFQGISTIKFNKDGSVSAAVVAESGGYTFDSGDEITQGYTSCSAQKHLVISKPTVEAERFSNGQFSYADLGAKQGEALARSLDAVWIALFPSITNLVTATSTLTKDDLLDAQYTVHDATKLDDRLHVMIARKGRNEIRKELTSISASAFSSPNMLSLVDQPIQANGLVGEFSDMLVFNSSGFATTGGDNQQAVYHPQLAFGIGIDTQVYTRSSFVASGGMWTEVASWLFANVVLWNDSAACELRSDS